MARNLAPTFGCRIGIHHWKGDPTPGPGSERWCNACGKTQVGAYDGIEPHWRTVPAQDERGTR